MSNDTSSLIVRASEGDSTFLATGELLIWKATGETTGGKYDQAEVVTLPQGGPVEHSHTQDELYYFLEGTFRVKLGDQIFTASAGDFVRIPAGTSHAYRCIGNSAGKMLLTYVPGGVRGFFEEIRPLLLSSEIDIPKAITIGAKYGLVLTGPPLTD